MSGEPKVVKQETTIDHNWGSDSPAPGVPANHFSARITKTIEASGGTYRFNVTADDGVKVLLDNKVIIDQFKNQPATEYYADVVLDEQFHSLQIDYYENERDAVLKFNYFKTDAPFHQNNMHTPYYPLGSFRGEYFDSINLDEKSTVIHYNEPSINYDWGKGTPDPRLHTDNFSARWTGNIDTVPGNYNFSVTADDGVKLYVNDILVIDQWNDHASTTYNTNINLSEDDPHTLGDMQKPHFMTAVRLEYYEKGGNAVMKFNYIQNTPSPTPPTDPTKIIYPIGTFRGEYYNSRNLDENLAAIHDSENIDFDWGSSAPLPNMNTDNFSVRWIGRFSGDDEVDRISLTADDGIRMYIDGGLVLDHYQDQVATTFNYDLSFAPHENHLYTIKIEYYEHQWNALAKFKMTKIDTIIGAKFHDDTISLINSKKIDALIDNQKVITVQSNLANTGNYSVPVKVYARWVKVPYIKELPYNTNPPGQDISFGDYSVSTNPILNDQWTADGSPHLVTSVWKPIKSGIYSYVIETSFGGFVRSAPKINSLGELYTVTIP